MSKTTATAAAPDDLQTVRQLYNTSRRFRNVASLIAAVDTVALRAAVQDLTTRTIAQRRVSEEGQDGLKAFLEKRKPGWQ